MNLKDKLINYLVYPFILVIFFVLVYTININYLMDDFDKKELVFAVEIRVQDDDIFQLFYRDSTNNFSETNSQRINIKNSSNFKRIRFIIPDSINLLQLRFDIGNKSLTSPVEIKNAYLSYNGFEKNFTEDSFIDYFKANRFIIADSKTTFSRKVLDKRSDPIFISKILNEDILNLKNKVNYNRVVINLVISFFLTFAFFLAVKKYEPLKTGYLEAPKLFVGVFLFLLVSPFLDSIFSLDDTNVKEKRNLAIKPTFSYKNIDGYPSSFESYFNDNFGFRNALISTGGILKAKIFNTSPRLDKVVVGKNNWLFYWENASRNSFYNLQPFKENDLGHFGKMLMKVKNKASEIDAIFVVSIYPNKHNIYLEYLPALVSEGINENGNRKKQLELFLKKEQIPFISHENLNSYKNTYRQLYYKNDSHWNTVGALVAYQNLIRGIKNYQQDLKDPLALNDFNLKVKENYYSGDLLDIMGIDNTNGYFNDVEVELTPKLKENERGPMSIDSKNARVFRNANSKSELTLLIYGDSFNLELLKLIPINFKKVIFVRGYKINTELIDYYEPNVILYGIVQRNLENF